MRKPKEFCSQCRCTPCRSYTRQLGERVEARKRTEKARKAKAKAKHRTAQGRMRQLEERLSVAEQSLREAKAETHRERRSIIVNWEMKKHPVVALAIPDAPDQGVPGMRVYALTCPCGWRDTVASLEGGLDAAKQKHVTSMLSLSVGDLVRL